VAEGQPVDWKSVEESANGKDEQAIVRQLQVLAKLTDAVRNPQVTPPTATPRAGTQMHSSEMWGHLRISDVMGEGSFGSVYRAWDTRLECEVALKLIKASGVSHAFDLARALKEARLLARVRHTNVVKVYGADSHAGRFGLWMELISGRTLEHVLAMHGPMGMSEAIPIGVDLCHALAAVHGAGLLHRDIKAHNVMREEGGRIVLMDFGTGRHIEGGREMSDSLAGTPLYLAPELFSGAKPSAASDIYSLAVLLYHLVTGEYPVRGNNRADVESAHLQARRQPLRDVRPDLPPAFIEVVERALSPNPTDRYRSAGKFGNALAALAGVHYADDPHPTPRFQRRWQVALIAASVAGVLMAVDQFRGRTTEDARSLAIAATPGSSSPASAVTSALPQTAASSYEIAASFYTIRNGKEMPLTHGSRVSPGDKLFAVVDASQPVFVYIVNRDETGQSFLLHPLPGFSPGNPVLSQPTSRLPGFRDGQQHFWEVTSAGGREHFFLYVTPNRLVEFEQVLAALPQAELGRNVSSLPLSSSAIGILRGVGGLSAAPNTTNLSRASELADLVPLTEQTESAQGVWARRISFENPAP
jgi:serine/threonine-protein kinase